MYSEPTDRADHERGKRAPVLLIWRIDPVRQWRRSPTDPRVAGPIRVIQLAATNPPAASPQSRRRDCQPYALLSFVELLQAYSPLHPRAVTSPPVRTDAGVGTGTDGGF